MLNIKPFENFFFLCLQKKLNQAIQAEKLRLSLHI